MSGPKKIVDSLEEFEKKTQEIEDEKERKKQEREKNKREKELKKKRQKQEKMVAPFLFFLTFVISLVVYLIFR